MKFITQRLDEIEEKDKQLLQQDTGDEAPVKVDFLTYILHSGKMSLDAITANIIDLLTAGVDTVCYPSLFCSTLLPQFYGIILHLLTDILHTYVVSVLSDHQSRGSREATQRSTTDSR